MSSIYRILTLTVLVCFSGCIRDHAVAVTNNTEDILYDVTYSDCYWSVLQPGETSEVCIPSAREDHVRFFLIDITEEEVAAPNNTSGQMSSGNMTTMNTGAGNTTPEGMANNTSENNATSGMTGGMMGGMTGGMMGGGMMGGGMPPRPMTPPRYRTTDSFTLGEDEAASFDVEDDAFEADPDYNPRPAPI